MKKLADTEVQIAPLIAERWSPRVFDPEFIMDENSVKSLLEAARWAPSCFGDQPWKFVIFHKKDASMWAKALNCLSVGNQNWAMDTSLLICVCANKNFKHNDNENKWAKYDSGAASENICLQSTYLGLAAHQMGGFDSDKIRNLANIPVEFDVVSFIAVGKPLAEDLLSNEQHEAEGAKRKRLKLSEIYFENEWNNFKG
ncbi:MAG: nitroreductase family protein [Nitrosomonadales bacterium]|jgi:nitroreductase|nr:nitroreductase family protein [Nitrosomonadales bacterium]MBT5150218.1 nitroreductase family protein [Nitrosomonadales bacterium]MBT6014329.1 nitroreductase family protein [Nitrosomonadales bacterium]MBT6251364.1 nitroreductase family protein [Nitrosomonadales bacterium]MBT6603111.1 nitroreductase family protein [Nitrosomonadales bacterium]